MRAYISRQATVWHCADYFRKLEHRDFSANTKQKRFIRFAFHELHHFLAFLSFQRRFQKHRISRHKTREFTLHPFDIKIKTLVREINAFISGFSISDGLLESSILTRYPPRP
jgi:hypothetical protein